MSFPTVIFFHQLVRCPHDEHLFFRNATTPEQFRSLMVRAKERYCPISMEEMYRGWENGRQWPKRAVLITFDDGFRNNLWAARILHELGMSAVFFVCSDVVDSDFKPWYIRFRHILTTRRLDTCTLGPYDVDLRYPLQRWHWLATLKEYILSLSPSQCDAALDELASKLEATPIDLKDENYQYMTGADLRELCDLGMCVGSHSASHTNLTRCDDRELRREIVESRERLTALAGQPVEYMSYPDGRFNDRVIDMTSKHYRLAFAATWMYPADNPWCYPRRNADNKGIQVLGPWYPVKRRFIGMVKRCLHVR